MYWSTQALGLQFRHTDNINHWRKAMTVLGLPTVSEDRNQTLTLIRWLVWMWNDMFCSLFVFLKIFHPETTDIYDKKNMPRAVYCIHALRSDICIFLAESSIRDSETGPGPAWFFLTKVTTSRNKIIREIICFFLLQELVAKTMNRNKS